MARFAARALLPALALVLAACRQAGAPVPPDASIAREWLDAQYALVRGERIAPPVASRVFAYAAVAFYEGLVPGSDSLRSLAGQLNGLDSLPRPDDGARYDWTDAAIVAQATALRGLYADGFVWTLNAIDELEARQLARRDSAGVPDDVRRRSVAWGQALGAAILAWAGRDGYADVRARPYDPPADRRYWVNTTTMAEYTAQSISPETDLVFEGNPAATLATGLVTERVLLMNRPKAPRSRTSQAINPTQALEPFWGRLRPFVLRDGDECAPPPPAPYSESSGSDYMAQVRAVYEAGAHLTEAQRRTALFWADNPGQTGTPPGHWVSIMRQSSAARGLSLERSAEMFALTSLAMADAFIGCWAEKYRSRVVRPITAIRRTLDSAWVTAVVTPPFPEYTSGHSVQSGAAAEVLGALLGDAPFRDSTHVSMGHAPRDYPSFRAAAEEAAISRLYGGIHYPMAIENGLAQGRCIGRTVVQRLRTRRHS